MKSTSSTYKQIMASGNARNYNVQINMTLADETTLTLTEDDIWADSFEIDTASSGTSTFDIGCAVIGKCKLQLNNFDERFNQYDFFNASAVVFIQLEGDNQYYRMGTFTVDEPTFSGALISLELLDDMWKFDTNLPTISYPTTIRAAIITICNHCGVVLGSATFHGEDFVLTQAPEDEMNCREFLQYAAMIGCNFCVMSPTGALLIRWYDSMPTIASDLDGGTFDTSTTPYSDGDSADGGNFTDYTSGDSHDGGSFSGISGIDYFTRNFSTNLGTDEITITGVKFVLDDTAYTIGSAGYVLELDNPFVTVDNVNTVLNLIWDVLEDFTFRTFSVSTVSDLAVEVGDACAVMDLHGNIVYTYVSNNSFAFTNHQVSLGAISPSRALSKRYSKNVQAAVEIARKKTDERISDYDLAVQRMNNLAINAMGAYQEYEDSPTGGRIYYLSNMPITKDAQGHCSFETGSSVFKATGDGFFVSTDGGQTWTNGYDVHTGELIVNVLYTIGLHADWIYTGTLTVGGTNVRTTNPQIQVKDANNNVICTINSNGIIMGKGYIASSDYADTNPVSNYSQSGMKIDVNDKYIKSPYFGIDMNGAHLKGEIEATSGKIGAATITSDSIKIIGDIELYSGTGTFTFKPYDYYFAADFKLSLEAVDYVSGSATVTLVKHENGSDTTVGTYTVTDEVVETATLDHTIGLDPDDYYRITISGFAVSVSAHDVLLAYMGQEGFKGILEGIFKGYIDANGKFRGEVDSDNGTLAGFDYQRIGKFTHSNDVVDWNNHRTYNNSKSVGWTPNGFHFVDKNSTGNLDIVFAIDNGFDDSQNEGVTDLANSVPRISFNLDKNANQSTANITRMQDYNGQGAASVVWNDELPGIIDAALVGLYTITDVDPGEGAPLAAGHFILVVEDL